MSHSRTFTFESERAPCGQAGGLRALDTREPGLDLSDCLVARETPRLIVIWEPLKTKAPAPPASWVWCCYIRTVIFYKYPHVVLPPEPWTDQHGVVHPGSVGSFAEWDQLETRMTWDDLVEFEGGIYKIGGGQVRWAAERWWVCRWARYEPGYPEDTTPAAIAATGS